MNVQTLRDLYRESMDDISTRIDEFPWEHRSHYANWLRQSYFFVRHSTRLLGFACAKASFEQNQLHLRMAKHVSEEFAHEKLAQKDLNDLGFDCTELAELSATKLFYRNQYYGIERFGAPYLLGYILYLEGLAVTKGPVILKKTEAQYPHVKHMFVRVHAEEDIDHINKAFHQIELLHDCDIELATESLVISHNLYKNILAQICEIKTPHKGITLTQTQPVLET